VGFILVGGVAREFLLYRENFFWGCMCVRGDEFILDSFRGFGWVF